MTSQESQIPEMKDFDVQCFWVGTSNNSSAIFTYEQGQVAMENIFGTTEELNSN